MDEIGARVQQLLSQATPERLQRDVASAVDMTQDAFSRSLRGERRFTSVELARIADLLDADLYWIVTGTPDVNRMVVAARHSFDHETGSRVVPGHGGDRQVLNDIELAYRQAYPESGTAPSLPGQLADVRSALGDDFVRPFAERLETRLGVDVVRVAELSTAYSATVAGHHVVMIPATGNWFYENFCMAHELGHLALGHHAVTASQGTEFEAQTNGFAADLLLPRSVIESIGWDSIAPGALAHLVWEWGVSTESLAARCKAVLGTVPTRVAEWSGSATQRLLRRHLRLTLDPAGDPLADEITDRMDEAARRRFPKSLQDAHLDRIARGRLGKQTLAWMLGIDAGDLEVDEPDFAELSPEALELALGR